ncbi:transglycosylase SLT domain-containing protein [Novosphingobium flavum]|uniref:Transglycosylase SLT domain-containing protein n=1 Tax=Novosphingobium flavum TaxID=1778672 RepID=A0A7X1FRI3_9SPHN|nr:transglycosylase SLT domain-containing protein [Novosphingobium flavum]
MSSSGVNSAGSATAAPAAVARAAIARAANATGVDFDYLLAQAKLESGLDPHARSGSSSATGLYQFLGSTWIDTLKKHGAEHGLGWAGAAASDPAMRAQIMALRHDPQASALMAAELASDNKAALSGHLGREPDAAELYLAHFLGAQGAGQFLSALASDPSQSAASVLPAAAATNRAIFFSPSGPRSVSEVMSLLRSRVAGAMEGGDASQWANAMPYGASPASAAAAPQFTGGPVARAFQAAAQGAQAPTSMAETLRQTFNLGGNASGEGAAPANVAAAYHRLSALGF